MKKIVSFLTIVTLAGASLSAQAADAAAGKTKYDTLCAACHGATGKGDGMAAAALNPKPRNLADPAVMSKKTDADLAKVIKNGGAAVGLSPTMPPWAGSLSDDDIANVIAHIRTFK